MARKRKIGTQRRGYGEGHIKEIIKDEKYEIRISDGTNYDGRRRRPYRVVHGRRTEAVKQVQKLQREIAEGK